MAVITLGAEKNSSAALSRSKNTLSYIYKATFISPRASTYLIMTVKYPSHGCEIIFTAATCEFACFLMFLSFYSLTVININIPIETLSECISCLGVLSAMPVHSGPRTTAGLPSTKCLCMVSFHVPLSLLTSGTGFLFFWESLNQDIPCVSWQQQLKNHKGSWEWAWLSDSSTIGDCKGGIRIWSDF